MLHGATIWSPWWEEKTIPTKDFNLKNNTGYFKICWWTKSEHQTMQRGIWNPKEWIFWRKAYFISSKWYFSLTLLRLLQQIFQVMFILDVLVNLKALETNRETCFTTVYLYKSWYKIFIDIHFQYLLSFICINILYFGTS